MTIRKTYRMDNGSKPSHGLRRQTICISIGPATLKSAALEVRCQNERYAGGIIDAILLVTPNAALASINGSIDLTETDPKQRHILDGIRLDTLLRLMVKEEEIMKHAMCHLRRVQS